MNKCLLVCIYLWLCVSSSYFWLPGLLLWLCPGLKKKDGAPDLTPGTFLEDEGKNAVSQIPKDFTELKDAREEVVRDSSFMNLLIFRESKIAMFHVWGFSPRPRLNYFIVLEGKSYKKLLLKVFLELRSARTWLRQICCSAIDMQKGGLNKIRMFWKSSVE